MPLPAEIFSPYSLEPERHGRKSKFFSTSWRVTSAPSSEQRSDPLVFFSSTIRAVHVHWNLDTTLCFGSRWRYSIVSETAQTALYGTSGGDISLYYCLCFWRQNYGFANVSLKTHIFSANVSLC